MKGDLSGLFGAMAYAVKDLVAEFDAAFLCAELGISGQPREDHAVYLAGWFRVLNERNRAIVSATSGASAARQYLTGLESASD